MLLKSIADVGEITEEKLLEASRMSQRKLFYTVFRTLVIRSLIIVILTYVFVAALIYWFAIYIHVIWLLYIEVGLILIYAGMVGTFNSSSTISKLKEMLNMGKLVDKSMVNDALRSTIAISALAIFIAIEALILENIGLYFIPN